MSETFSLFNPITYSNEVLKQFLRYQLTKYRFTDPDLAKQLRQLISYDHFERSKLLKGPYVSIEKQFKQGSSVKDLAKRGIIEPALASIAPFPYLYAHQEVALNNIQQDKNTIIATSTGSGKTESFLYPILDYCFKIQSNPDQDHDGVVAVLIYPMNALANDQLDRLRELLSGTGISFGIYTGQTPRSFRDIKEEYAVLKDGQGREKFDELKKTKGKHYRVFPNE